MSDQEQRLQARDYVLDVSLSSPAWCELMENGDVMIGLSIIVPACPGNAAGIYHGDGQEAVEAWCEAHPDWMQWLESGEVPAEVMYP